MVRSAAAVEAERGGASKIARSQQQTHWDRVNRLLLPSRARESTAAAAIGPGLARAPAGDAATLRLGPGSVSACVVLMGVAADDDDEAKQEEDGCRIGQLNDSGPAARAALANWLISLRLWCGIMLNGK